jgi:ketosteroid isomerase-like protein
LTSNAAANLAERLVRSFGDPEAIGALLTDDAEWWITPTVRVLGSPSVGREAIVASMRTIFGELWGDSRVIVHNVIGDDDIGAVRLTLKAKALFRSGADYSNEYSVWVRRRGDRIDRVWEYLDVAWSTAQFDNASGGNYHSAERPQ